MRPSALYERLASVCGCVETLIGPGDDARKCESFRRFGSFEPLVSDGRNLRFTLNDSLNGNRKSDKEFNRKTLKKDIILVISVIKETKLPVAVLFPNSYELI